MSSLIIQPSVIFRDTSRLAKPYTSYRIRLLKHLGTVTSLITLVLAISDRHALSLPVEGWLVANRWAEETCINAAEDEGLRVTEILGQNSYTGGSEVIMRVQQRRQSYVLGCDYADNTRQVQLYRLDDFNQESQHNFGDESESNRVSGSEEAKYIARQTIEEQLGVDADSDVIQISETRRSNQRWYVRGEVNGAPFSVTIDRDGTIEDFQLR